MYGISNVQVSMTTSRLAQTMVHNGNTTQNGGSFSIRYSQRNLGFSEAQSETRQYRFSVQVNCVFCSNVINSCQPYYERAFAAPATALICVEIHSEAKCLQGLVTGRFR